jgi:hypothetical protein
MRFAPANDNRSPAQPWIRWLAIIAAAAAIIVCVVQYGIG